MNIIGGKFRGKKLTEYFSETTRPTTGRVRENIFNVLGASVQSASVLDLFAGTGLYGIEALSRGASLVVLNDADSAAVAVIRKNLAMLKETGCKTQVLNCESRAALQKLSTQKFDIIFLDPPYETTLGKRTIEHIINNKMLAADGIIVFETDAAQTALNLTGLDVRTKKYGRAKIYFIKASDKQ